jgi:hypothetical protein
VVEGAASVVGQLLEERLRLGVRQRAHRGVLIEDTPPSDS